jgi:hypothetical protein
LFIPFKFIIFHVGDPLDSWGDTALTVDPRSALKLKSLQVVERFGVPPQTALNQWIEVRAKVYAACGV